MFISITGGSEFILIFTVSSFPPEKLNPAGKSGPDSEPKAAVVKPGILPPTVSFKINLYGRVRHFVFHSSDFLR